MFPHFELTSSSDARNVDEMTLRLFADFAEPTTMAVLRTLAAAAGEFDSTMMRCPLLGLQL